MFERFTDRARKVMALANQEAQRFNHETIGPEHVLLGMVKEPGCLGVKIMEQCQIDPRKVRLEVEKLIKSGPDMVTMGKLPQTPATKLVIDMAMAQARQFNHNYVGTEHLLFALIIEDRSIAATALKLLGLDFKKAHEAYSKVTCEDAPMDDAAGDKGRTFAQWFTRDMERLANPPSLSDAVSLRDWFIGAAITGILANEKLANLTVQEKAQGACNIADELLAARKTKTIAQ